MLDDSWDSVSSTHSSEYNIKKKATNKSTVVASKVKKDDKYNFPSPLHKRNTIQLDNSFDNDVLFSPTNSQGTSSMLPSPNENKKMLNGYDQDSPDKKDYLANFITNSADLEDSILGELLGGGKKKTNLPKPPAAGTLDKLSSNDNSMKTKSSTQNVSKLQSIEMIDKSDNTARKSRNKSPLSKDFKGSRSPPKLSNIRDNTRKQSNSIPPSNNFDVSESLDIDSELNSPYGRSAAGNNSPYNSDVEDNKLKASGKEKTSSDHYIPSITATNNSYIPSNFGYKDHMNNNSEDNEDNATTTGLSFIPSFMEQGRQNRRRRNLDGPDPSQHYQQTINNPNNESDKLDDLDRALGIGLLPTTNNKKAITDPFSATERKFLPTTTTTKQGSAAATGFNIDSDDSSSDDAILRRSRQKDYFPVAKKVIVNNSSSSTATNITNRNNNTEASSDISKSTTAPAIHSNKVNFHAANNSLPTISRSPGGMSTQVTALPQAINNSKQISNTTSSLPVTQGEDEDELDVSGIVRINLDDDLLSHTLNNSEKKKDRNFQKSKPSTVVNTKNAIPGSSSGIISSNNKQDSIGFDASSSSTSRYNSSWKPSNSTMNDNIINEENSSATAVSDQPLVIRTSLNSLEGNDLVSAGSLSGNTKGFPTTTTIADGYARDRSSNNAYNNISVEKDPSVLKMQHAYNVPKKTTVSSSYSTTAFENPSMTLDDKYDYSYSTKASSQIAQQLQNEREISEMKQLKEVEALKIKLAQTNTMIDRSSKDDSSTNAILPTITTTTDMDYNQLNHQRHIQEINIQYTQQNIEQKRTIAYLESEISRLKDEANIKALRNHEDISRMKERYETEINDIKLRNTIDVESLERRHEESLNALRKLHENEIQAIKERFKSEEKFDQIAGQLRTTSGSIRFIEEQLQSRQKGVEAIREGQIDARERLLADMEEKARERAELAEAEGYRLKGILSHMEHVVNTLREQGSEERERLRLEHSRLQSRQHSFEAEKTALQQRNMEELNYIKQRSKEVEIELLKLTQEKQAHFEAQAASQFKLDSEKSEFAIYYAAKSKSLELTEVRLKEEESRLVRLRESIAKEKQNLDDRKDAALREIESAEELHRMVVQEQRKIENEKQEITRLSLHYSNASEELTQKEIAINEQLAALQEKELAIREGFAQLKLAASELAQRERELQQTTQYMERKKIAMDKSDNDLQSKKLAIASNFREWSAKQITKPLPHAYGLDSSSNSYNNDAPEVLDSYNYKNENHNKTSVNPDRSKHHPSTIIPQSQQYSYNQPNDFMSISSNLPIPPVQSSYQQQKQPSYINNYPETSVSWLDSFQAKLQATKQHSLNPGSEGISFRMPVEVRTAQSTLRQYKNQMNKIHHSSVQVQKLINDENDFLNALQNKNSLTSNITASY